MAGIAIGELSELLEAAWRSVTDGANARFIADSVVATALEKDERMDPVSGTLKDLEKYAATQTRSMTCVASRGASRVYDLNAGPGIVYMKAIQHEAERLAREAGVAAIGLRNSAGVHELSAWVKDPPGRGFLVVFMWNGGSYTTAPFGSRQPFFGTNPIAYGIPTVGEPIILDMSTSEIPFVSLNHALRLGKAIPSGSGLDPEGLVTTDPKEVHKPSVNEEVRLLPMGAGYKGSAIMLLMEVLTGALVGAKMAREATDDPWIPEEFGGLYLCFDTSAFTLPAAFTKSVAAMADDIRGSLPRHGVDKIRLPGDAAREREHIRRANGHLELTNAALAELHRWASRTATQRY